MRKRKLAVKPIPSRYKLMGKERHIVVEAGRDSFGKVYRIVGRLWGK